MSALATTSRQDEYRRRAPHLSPGGAHTYAKGDDQYPEDYPAFIVRGSGCHVWDVDGTERIDFNGNYTSLVIGHAHPDVVKAVQTVAAMGLSFPGPTEHEIRLGRRHSRERPSASWRPTSPWIPLRPIRRSSLD